jgi:methylenetetrahydromethanopterin dehydrogenase
MVTVTFLKIGYIGTTTLVEALLDERAARRDLTMRVVGSGVNMDDAEAEDIANLASNIPSDLYVVVSPNAGLSGPKKARDILKETEKPIIVISDEPSRKAARELPKEGIGYIVIYGDPMIGAKQQFLDPIEMAVFNSDVIKVLAISGALRVVQKELDRVIEEIKNNEVPQLPEIIINKNVALANCALKNPYAQAKAIAAFEAARKVATLSTEGTFRIKERENYLPVLAAAHELISQAAKLADEAREIEKSNDTTVRTPHYRQGNTREKLGLFDSPK